MTRSNNLPRCVCGAEVEVRGTENLGFDGILGNPGSVRCTGRVEFGNMSMDCPAYADTPEQWIAFIEAAHRNMLGNNVLPMKGKVA